MTQAYNLIIVGGGPAGLTAGIYAGRARLSTILLERALWGGQIVNAENVENFPGFPQGVSGMELGELMHKQATSFGLETLTAEVTGIALAGGNKIVKTDRGDFSARALILAGGAERQKLGVPGEEKLTGKGVSYCATCDGAFFQEVIVAVVGGGDAALNEALSLTHFASKVVVIHRRQELRASKIVQERAFANPKISFIWDSVVEAIEGEEEVRQLKLRNIKTGKESSLEVGGIFVAIGFKPNTSYLQGLLKLDGNGHIITDGRLQTTVPGIFAAGDIRHDSARQAIAAAGDGATAALSAERYLTES